MSAQPIRVVFFCDAHELGGAEVSLGTLLSLLSPRIEATVMGVDEHVVSWLARHRPSMPTVVLPKISDRRDLRATLAHIRAIRRLAPTLLHVSLNHPWASQWDVLAGLAIPGVKVIGVEKLPSQSPHRRHRLYKRVTSPRLSAHVTLGPTTAAMVAEFSRVPVEGIRVIPSGVVDDPRRQVPRPTTGPVIGSLARLEPQKGIDVLVRAMTELPTVTAVVVGEGPERAALTELASSLGIADRLVFTGWQERARDHLTSFDVYVQPSRFEAFGVSIVEAMLAGLPVVATAAGGTCDAVADGETGILVAADDPHALAQAIKELLADPDRARAMGRAGRERALQRFTGERMASGFEALYSELS
jgi:glycosyltransferase involved in cell wall biosynthesis